MFLKGCVEAKNTEDLKKYLKNTCKKERGWPSLRAIPHSACFCENSGSAKAPAVEDRKSPKFRQYAATYNQSTAVLWRSKKSKKLNILPERV